MEWLTTATTGVISVMTTVITTITTTPVLALCFAGAVIIPLGARVFKQLRG